MPSTSVASALEMGYGPLLITLPIPYWMDGAADVAETNPESTEGHRWTA